MTGFPVSIGDQQAYHDLIDTSTEYLSGLSNQLIQSYNELESQTLDVSDLGSAAEALIFAVDRLKDQKVKLESYRKKLREGITSEPDKDNK